MQIQDNIELGTNSQIGMKSIYSSSTAKINENIENDLAFNIQLVDYFIRRSYLTDLNKCEVLESSLQDTTGIRLFRISKIIYDENEDINEKLSNVYSALQNIGVSVLLFIKGTVSGVEYYLGLRGENKAGIPSGLLNDAFVANFPGSSLVRLYDSQIRELLNDQHFDNIASVTVVPSVREDNEKKFIQGIEKLIDTMQGKEYSALFISSPVSKANLAARRAGLEKLYSALSPFAKTSLSFGENESFAVTQGRFENFATTVNDNIANTLGKSETETNSNSTSYRFLCGTGFSSSSSFSSGVSASEGLVRY